MIIKSKEVTWHSFCWLVFLLLRRWIVFLVVVRQIIPYFKHWCTVSASVTVIRSRKYCYAFFFVRIIIPVHYQLMSSTNHLQIISVIKFVANIFPPAKTSASRRRTKSWFTLISRIRPKEITECPIMWDILNPINWFNLIKLFYFRRESSMKTKDFIFNNCW